MIDAPRRTLRTSAIVSLLGASLAGPVGPAALDAQHETHGATPKSAASRLGDISFANSGTPAAQPACIRGLALLHNFQYPQAAAAFREAQKLDPGFAMAYWGEAMTYNHGVWKEQDSVAARAVLQRFGATPAERLAKAPTAREKDYLRTLDVLYSAPGTKEARDSAYATATAQLAARGTAWDAFRRGDTARVVQLLDQMRQTRAKFDASPMAKGAPERGRAMGVREDELRALMLLRRGSNDDAVALLRAAAQREDALPFMFGPPMIEKPARELLGEVLLQIGRPADARHELELSLNRTPGRSVALLDLARANAASGDSAAARAPYKQLGTNWHRADPTIPALGEVRGAAPAAARS
ncbi:MAG TPA: hypothetical protein VII52_07040 [Gemmatimonadaceae bacterium]